MPQPGETRKGATETVQWDGSRWQQIPHDTSDQQPQGSAIGRFLSGAASTTPFNPMNVLHAVLHPIDTATSIVGTPAVEGVSALQHFKNAITNPGNEGGLGRLAEFVQGVRDTGGAVPLIGKAAVDAGGKIGNGDIAGGAGELAGLASSAALPSAIRNSGRGISAVGRGAEAVGNATTRLSPLGAVEGALNGDWKGAALAAAPYALKYGGQGLQSLGDAIDGLVNPEPAQGPLPTVTDQGNVRAPQTTNLLRPARTSTAAPTAPAAGWDVNPDFQKFASDSPVTTDTGANANAQEYMSNLLRGGVMDRAAAMGDATMNSLRKAGYDVPATGGISSYADIDRLVASRPSVEGITPVEEPPVAQSQPNDTAVDSMLDDLGTRLTQVPTSFAKVNGQSVPVDETPAQPTMPSSWEKFSSASDNGTRSAAPEVPLPDSMNAIDKMFGPGSTDLQGQSFQSTAGRGGNNLLYDPQTPTDYLREQYLDPNASDADRSFLGRALRQRLRLGNSANSVSALQ